MGEEASTLGTQIAVMATQMDQMARDLRDLKAAVMGNGKPGLKDEVNEIKAQIGYRKESSMDQRVATIEDFVIEWKKDREANRESIRKIFYGLLQDALKVALGALMVLIATRLFPQLFQ